METTNIFFLQLDWEIFSRPDRGAAAATALATPTEQTLRLASASCLCGLRERRLLLPALLPVVVGGRVAPSGEKLNGLESSGAGGGATT